MDMPEKGLCAIREYGLPSHMIPFGTIRGGLCDWKWRRISGEIPHTILTCPVAPIHGGDLPGALGFAQIVGYRADRRLSRRS